MKFCTCYNKLIQNLRHFQIKMKIIAGLKKLQSRYEITTLLKSNRFHTSIYQSLTLLKLTHKKQDQIIQIKEYVKKNKKEENLLQRVIKMATQQYYYFNIQRQTLQIQLNTVIQIYLFLGHFHKCVHQNAKNFFKSNMYRKYLLLFKQLFYVSYNYMLGIYGVLYTQNCPIAILHCTNRSFFCILKFMMLENCDILNPLFCILNLAQVQCSPILYYKKPPIRNFRPELKIQQSKMYLLICTLFSIRTIPVLYLY
eukprot:TRINITY_DN35201_c0_g1_i1.p2 TRINITY_DN35201_c0_g1~~TRINITY_DN35201_c0_g1_i1.p2  ORF type:complete len:254 (-),score=-28.21 TRINITY_DN35201_c0_g1_i1:1046-1807(-)